MNTFRILLALVAALSIFACEPGIEKQMEQAILEAEQAESLSGLTITDTISVAKLEEVRTSYEQALASFEEQANALPVQIENAKKRMAEAEEKMASAPKMLQESWQDIFEQESKNLIDFEDILNRNKEERKFVESQIAFVNQALANQQDSVAYYNVSAQVGAEEKTYQITPNYLILNNK